jgi:hypothetical protein
MLLSVLAKGAVLAQPSNRSDSLGAMSQFASILRLYRQGRSELAGIPAGI